MGSLDPVSDATVSGVQESARESDLYSILEICGKNAKNPAYGASFHGPLRIAEEKGVKIVLMPAEAQEGFDFVTGLQHIARWKGLDKDAQVWWAGGDLTGIYAAEQTQQAIKALELFARRFLMDGMGRTRKDRLLISEYAGPERANGSEACAIRCVGKLLEKLPVLTDCFLPYAVVSSAGWFKNIGAVAHRNVKHLYVVHGERPGHTDAWDSNNLARNAVIVEGGARTLGYIFDIIANKGLVIGLHGFRTKTADFYDTKLERYYLSASKFVGDLCNFLKENPASTHEDVMRFWQRYIIDYPPFNPAMSDASTKQYYIDTAWKVFQQSGFRQKLLNNFKSYSYEEFMRLDNNFLGVSVESTLFANKERAAKL